MRNVSGKVLGIVVALMLSASSASADIVTVNLTGSAGEGSSWGNTLSFLMGGVTVTASAWGYTYGSSNNALQSGALGQWSTGLGVCNRDEGRNCGSPDHQVDNVGSDDFVLFTFSQAVDVTTIRIDPYGTWDRDVSYWTSSTFANTTNANLNGINYAGLGAAGLGFGGRTDRTYSASGNPLNVDPIAGGMVNAILFGARVESESSSSSNQDRFKIASITADVPRQTVPEPTSLMLIGAGILGAAATRKRRQR